MPFLGGAEGGTGVGAGDGGAAVEGGGAGVGGWGGTGVDGGGGTGVGAGAEIGVCCTGTADGGRWLKELDCGDVPAGNWTGWIMRCCALPAPGMPGPVVLVDGWIGVPPGVAAGEGWVVSGAPGPRPRAWRSTPGAGRAGSWLPDGTPEIL